MKHAIVAYSFGFRKNGPGKSNIALAKIVENIYNAEKMPVVAQDEIAQALGFKPSLIVKAKNNTYLGTDEVTERAAEFLMKRGVESVWVVTQPFLHRIKCRSLLEKKGFEVLTPRTGFIPFDRKSVQWWSRDPVRCLIYAILQVTTGRRGK